MAAMVLDPASLPPPPGPQEAATTPRGLRAALRGLCAAPAAAPEGPASGGEGASEALEVPVNTAEFEFAEAFGEDWEQRWMRGPCTQDEKGKPIREGLIHMQTVRYPANPKDAKPCLELVGGVSNVPCTGIWTSFSPLARPTEVEFEFTMNGKVDVPNACVVFTELALEGALQDSRIGVQFLVKGGMQLSGGSGNLVRISNDGKLQSDKWSKVLLKIDWAEKIVVGQVDSRGKGYAPAIQTVPFRDASCNGFGFVYIYNTDMQATCWFHSLRIKQGQPVEMDTEALEARAQLAARLKEREYQRAVDEDMEVGMKMGAIKSTKEHGMNLAMEQAANAGGGAARMG
ncbi:unnamed protein product [Prorocentrum cordatum]|uniref:Uncharacterized protein n=1 Tax=Prorocentrum cordatum TaxID=2364126 RepID=A0ABN9VKD9_9DINO|nr:unnamed protein product [Polarella glacialis]